MSGFDDLIPAAMPFLASEVIEATNGTSWEVEYLVFDDDDALVNMTVGFTGSASIRSTGGGEVLAPTLTFPSAGVVRFAATPAQSAAVAEGSYGHEVTITRSSDSAKIIIVGGGGGRFIVRGKVS